MKCVTLLQIFRFYLQRFSENFQQRNVKKKTNKMEILEEIPKVSWWPSENLGISIKRSECSKYDWKQNKLRMVENDVLFANPFSGHFRKTYNAERKALGTRLLIILNPLALLSRRNIFTLYFGHHVTY